MDVWETIGLWHYPIPGLYIFAQFCLGILVAMGNLVNGSVFLYLSDGDLQSTNDNCTVEGEEITVFSSVVFAVRSASFLLHMVYFCAAFFLSYMVQTRFPNLVYLMVKSLCP